jgi:putative transcriptional regulator
MATKREIILKEFGLHVKNIRLTKGFTQLYVCKPMGRDQQSLQRVESGKVNPSLIYMMELANGLEVSMEELTVFKLPSAKKKKVGK